jgi:hypothetical protein
MKKGELGNYGNPVTVTCTESTNGLENQLVNSVTESCGDLREPDRISIDFSAATSPVPVPELGLGAPIDLVGVARVLANLSPGEKRWLSQTEREEED